MDLIERVLRGHRPMAVICDVDGEEQDGFHAMKLIADYSRDLPIMLLTDGDAVLMGAADAVQDLWGLTSVTRTSGSRWPASLSGSCSAPADGPAACGWCRFDPVRA